MKFNSVVFDLDGTLLDTLGDLRDSVNFALEKNGLPKRTTEEVRSFVGNGIRLLIERSVPENIPLEIVDKCFSDFKGYYKDHSARKRGCRACGYSHDIHNGIQADRQADSDGRKLPSDNITETYVKEI